VLLAGLMLVLLAAILRTHMKALGPRVEDAVLANSECITGREFQEVYGMVKAVLRD